ncbi:hypothetical protein AAE02nite_22620 [Adhaeribacter aerolatus]|uniref:Lipocalin-like domain-containing protein n=1 Tax=Adhaeribacter aerolatus TaxID=670289 RepID=A0A512AY05_9BACT|nr:hypothetical protein [Adhaeribacter aerolatus]GEO04598.1 hypothetical protein AAE02nite_22620 [Adhaeribacter aerolatus]
MKTLIYFPLLFWLAGLGNPEKQQVAGQRHDSIKGSWKSGRIQIQYIVDSHLVHEQEIATEKGNVYDFDGTMVRVKYPDGTTAQGTYSVVREEKTKKVILHLPGITTTYTLIAVTSSRMVWQRDLDDVYYKAGQIQKSAERAIYTEELEK